MLNSVNLIGSPNLYKANILNPKTVTSLSSIYGSEIKDIDSFKKELEHLLLFECTGNRNKYIAEYAELANNKKGEFDPERGKLILSYINRFKFGTFDRIDEIKHLINDVSFQDRTLNPQATSVVDLLTNNIYSIKSNDVSSILLDIKSKNGDISQDSIDLIKHILEQNRLEIPERKTARTKRTINLLKNEKNELDSLAIKTYKNLTNPKFSYIIDFEYVENLIQSTKEKDSRFNKSKLDFINKIISEGIEISKIKFVIDFCTNSKGVAETKYISKAKKLISSHFFNSYLDVAKDVKSYMDLDHISQLNFRQKRDLLEKALIHGSKLYSSDIQKICEGKLLPKNEDSYLYMISKLSNSLGLNVEELSNDKKRDYFTSLTLISKKDSAFYNADFDTTKLSLSYSIEDFIKDVNKQTQTLSYTERTKVLDYYSFELQKNKDGNYNLNGYPNLRKTSLEAYNEKEKQAIKDLYPIIESFVAKNKVNIPSNKKLEGEINKLLSAFPEFYTAIGKKQHSTHDYTLDIHILKVLQEVVKNPYFENLNDRDKKVLMTVTLLHDLTKEENDIDSKHPYNSALDAYHLTSKLGLKNATRLNIYELIKNHDWLKEYATGKLSAKDIAFELRQGNSFQMASILTASDLKAIKKNNQFYYKHRDIFKKATNEICHYVNELRKTAIHLPQTKLPKASEIDSNSKYVRTINKDGIKNKVVYITPNTDLSKVGFKNIQNVNDLNLLLHGLDNKNQASMFQVLGKLDSDGLLSTSYMTYSQRNYKAFRKQGFILDVASDDIHVAYYSDFGSGYKKTKDTLKLQYLFKKNDKREYIPNLLKKLLKISDSEYVKLFPEIADRSITELRKSHPEVAKAMEKIYKEMEGCKRNNGRQYNEILVTRPAIQGVFCYDKSPNDIPKFLRKYAQDHDVPILFFTE